MGLQECFTKFCAPSIFDNMVFSRTDLTEEGPERRESRRMTEKEKPRFLR